ncbi:MAG: nicotinate (nicotinamide) nucleotide adenylyltransferase [Spirochaetaceae bacterium]|nr:nicotinate (nicotinamide) nucleotide adenylyltransferase [Spirochaetaceae bacterium]
MKFAILGGSFDPIHRGHIKLAEAALQAGYDRIIFVPAFHSPFKSEAQRDSAAIRLEMILAAISADRRFTVDDTEIKRGGLSYTIDTIKDISARYLPEGKPALVLGDDLIAGFPKWKDADKIGFVSDILVASREKNMNNFPYPHKLLNNETFELSSAAVRALIASGKAWHELTPNGVWNIIEDRALYGCAPRPHSGTPCSGEALGGSGSAAQKNSISVSPSLVDIENKVRSMLSIRRFLHSRNVALHCADLAARFGFDVPKAYLAGISHDMAKELPCDRMIELAQQDHLPFSPLELKKPSMLHGRAAAILIQECFGIDDADVIEALRYHTSGRAGMGPLAKIVYLTDKIETGRSTVDEKLRALAFGSSALADLNELFDIVHKATLEFLKARGLELIEWA